MKEKLKLHLESLVDFECYDDRPNTLKNVALQLFDEVVKHDRRNKVLSVKFTEAVQGLPSYLNLPFANYDIANLMFALGLEFDRENDDEYFNTCTKYWELVGEILMDEFNK